MNFDLTLQMLIFQRCDALVWSLPLGPRPAFSESDLSVRS